MGGIAVERVNRVELATVTSDLPEVINELERIRIPQEASTDCSRKGLHASV